MATRRTFLEPMAAALRDCPEEVFWKDTDGDRTPDFNRIFAWHLRGIYGVEEAAAVPIRDIEHSNQVWNLSSAQRAINKEAGDRRRRASP